MTDLLSHPGRATRVGAGALTSLLAALVERFESDGDGGTVIGCAYVGETADLPHLIRETLSARLPRHMLPSAWLALDHIPLNHHGKTDRAQLRDRFEEAGAVRGGSNPSATPRRGSRVPRPS